MFEVIVWKVLIYKGFWEWEDEIVNNLTMFGLIQEMI